ncbi:MAG: 4Fe-4S binding protein [Candidatus Altiarchaeales archaeon]|nr:4Fe-4S binding protein [Candidatus Altiarchaeales archaeon]
MVEINIDLDNCTGCGACVDSCPVGIYGLENGKAKVTGEVSECVMCRVCENSCPASAITVTGD